MKCRPAEQAQYYCYFTLAIKINIKPRIDKNINTYFEIEMDGQLFC